MIKKIRLIFNTIKYLKPQQFFGRFNKVLPRFLREVNRYPPIVVYTKTCPFIVREGLTKNYETFIFLHEKFNLKEVGWDNPHITKLWRYNLHYFEYLMQDDLHKNHDGIQYEIIENWLDTNPFGKGTAWEPYPTSLRIINWIKWHWKTGKLSEKAKISLWNQVRWLANRPEFHLLGNHLFINAKALMFAYVFFGQKIDSKIYKVAISIIKDELDEQFLEDGAHFELSPMYHALAMEDLLDLIYISDNLPIDFPKHEIIKRCKNGMIWLKSMIYDNEELSHFNDCANGIAPKYSELVKYAAKLGIDMNEHEVLGLNYHKTSGYVVFKDNSSHLIADFGKVGPDYLPGHAHADTLSFELAVKGNRVIVNSGTGVYGNSVERLRQRGTSSHSTIQIDEMDSSEVWSGFRVARRALTYDVLINFNREGRDGVFFTASHNGYKRLKNSPIHKRSFRLLKNFWFIEDEVSGEGNEVISRYFIHPEIDVFKQEEVFALYKKQENLLNISFPPGLQINIVNTTYHDEFGLSKSNKVIEVKMISPCKLLATFEMIQ